MSKAAKAPDTPGAPSTLGDPSARELTDPREIRALAHPVRVALLELLAREGALTATEAGEMLGESPANCSFHLRTLAKYGFVEEAPGGKGRQRPWRRVTHSMTFGGDAEPELEVAATELARHFDERAQRRRAEWLATRHTFDQPWRNGAFHLENLSYLTAEELDAVGEEILTIIRRYAGRIADLDARPEGSMPVAISAIGHPVPLTGRGH